MKTLRTLPWTDDRWEVAVMDVPVAAPDVRAILLVVEARTGKVRLATALGVGEAAATQLRSAFTRPSSGDRPARPRALLFRDPALLREAGAVLTEAAVSAMLADTLPAVDRVTASLLASFGGPTAPGITGDFGAWRQSLDTLVRSAPWAHVHDGTVFTFRGGGLDDAVGVLLGGDLRGLVVYASAADRARLLDAPPGRTSDATAAMVQLDSPPALTPAEQKACADAGLTLPGEAFPRLYGLREGRAHALDATEQRRFRLALDAVLALCLRRPADLAAGRAASHTLRRGDVVVDVHAAVDADRAEG